MKMRLLWLTMVSNIAKLIKTRSTTYEIKMKMKLLWLTMVSNIAKLIQTRSTTYDSTARLVKFCGEVRAVRAGS